MELKERILQALKPKAASFGFNKEELESAANAMADNFHSANEEATDEEINGAIDGIIPILRLAQSQSTRVIAKAKDDAAKAAQQKQEQNGGGKNEHGDEIELLKNRLNEMDERYNSLMAERTSDSRRKRVEDILKDSGSFGTRAIKDFNRATFQSEDDFNSYLEELKADKEAYLRETASAGGNTRPLGGGNVSQEQADEEAFAKSMEAIVKQN